MNNNKKLIWGVVIAVVIIGALCAYKLLIPAIYQNCCSWDHPYPNTEVSTAEWKTYTDSKLGYEIKYPSDWKIDQNEITHEIGIHNPKYDSIDTDDFGEFVAIKKRINKCEPSDWINTGTSNSKRICLPDGYSIYASTLSDQGKMIEDKILSTFKFTSPNPTNTSSSIKIISPNGGERIPFTDLVMAGDLGFKWNTTLGVSYVPSKDFIASVINENGVEVKKFNQVLTSSSNLGGGNFVSSFVNNDGITAGGRYKVKVCDVILGSQICDTSDDFFTITN